MPLDGWDPVLNELALGEKDLNIAQNQTRSLSSQLYSAKPKKCRDRRSLRCFLLSANANSMHRENKNLREQAEAMDILFSDSIRRINLNLSLFSTSLFKNFQSKLERKDLRMCGGPSFPPRN
mmetsp:Transcript_10742/g.44771  ORF Transcript_10742/g.44771 Transcript_10742/m.44771 type:complete len:122 (+) Transcript_10742:2803-3168(+)